MKTAIPKELILDLIKFIDYDIYKEYTKEAAEEPECVDEAWGKIEMLLNTKGYTMIDE